MSRNRISLLISLSLATGLVHGDGEPLLNSHAQAAVVEIKPRAAGSPLPRLPALEFPMRIEAGCTGDARAESISISIADTIETHDVGTSELADSNDIVLEFVFRVPGNQLAPITSGHFCTTDVAGQDDVRELLVPAIAAANISMRCANGNSRSVHYGNASLAVRLVCMSAEEESDGIQDQGAAALPARF